MTAGWIGGEGRQDQKEPQGQADGRDSDLAVVSFDAFRYSLLEGLEKWFHLARCC